MQFVLLFTLFSNKHNSFYIIMFTLTLHSVLSRLGMILLCIGLLGTQNPLTLKVPVTAIDALRHFETG